jgi:ATPase subunit of ABC transporter with duplicated ATPase domains
MTALADRYLTQRINPLATEIAHRWKLLFGSDGLRFGASGQLTFSDGGVDLLLEDLSGAERATAVLVTRLLLAASATRASMIWFDEPLEHLDPARRAAVAQTLVRAAHAGAVDQILVTTYEEGLARRLQATAPDTVSLTYAHTTTR